ncbi:hypothetical protein Tco_1578683 [Tanacetum coccineum]
MKDLQCLREGIIFYRKVNSEGFWIINLKKGNECGIQNGPYVRPLIRDPNGAENINSTMKQILEPLSKMIEGNKKQYIADMKVMNYLLQAIPNDIYNSVDACKNAKEMWERIKRLMFGSDVTSHVRHSRLMDEFDRFATKEGESLESVYERLTTLVNIMDRNNVCPISVSINTKFLNCLQLEWSKYVTMVCHNQTGETVSYDMLYDSLVQIKLHVIASKENKVAMNHDPLALISHSNASLSQSYAHSSYSPQSYYVTHPSSVDGRVDIQTKNAGNGGNDNKNAGRQSRNQAFNVGNGNDNSNQNIQRVPQTKSILRKTNVQCYNSNEKGHYAHDCQKPRVRDAKYFREQMLLAMKDDARSNLNNEENDFMLDTSYGDETMEDLIVVVMLIDRIQPADGNAETVLSYDAKAVSEVNASSKVHEQMCHEKRKTIIQTSDDDQIDSNIIFDDPYMENNSGTSDHDSNDHDEYHKIQMLAYDVQREAENVTPPN